MEPLSDEVRAMLEDGPQWTLLDSAPQDGTEVIVGNMRHERPAVGLGRYNGRDWDVRPLGGWTRPTAEEITHWLPLAEEEVRNWRDAEGTL
jgi:hypothetical protein